MTQTGDNAHLDVLRQVAIGVAYRMVGSRTDAEDLAQEAMLRVGPELATGRLRNPAAFTTTVTTRLAIDHLRLAHVRRESYIGPWLPEPTSTDPGPAASSELSDSLSMAFLVVLESLGPVERAAFLLRDVFSYDFAEIAEALGRSEDACRQLVSRARRRVADRRPRFAVDRGEHRRLLERFVDAARRGDVEQLHTMLTADAVLVSDGGGTRKAARRPIVGRPRVARFLGVVGPKALDGEIRWTPINGEPGVVVERDGEVRLAGTVELAEGRVQRIQWVVNSDKLRWVVPARS